MVGGGFMIQGEPTDFLFNGRRRNDIFLKPCYAHRRKRYPKKRRLRPRSARVIGLHYGEAIAFKTVLASLGIAFSTANGIAWAQSQ
jgi:hypothetical protein